MLPCCSFELLAGLKADDMSVIASCVLQCMCYYLLLGLATLALGVLGVALNAVQSFCASQVAGGFSLFAHRPRPQATTNSQQKKLQCAGHEPVCLVPESWTSICLCLIALFKIH